MFFYSKIVDAGSFLLSRLNVDPHIYQLNSEQKSSDTISLPDYVYVSGLPLFWRGCNGKYKLMIINNNPEYHLINHMYYGINLRHTYIKKENNFWKLLIEDSQYHFLAQSTSQNLFGDWDKISVTAEQSIATWWKSNSNLVSFVILILGIIYLLLFHDLFFYKIKN